MVSLNMLHHGNQSKGYIMGRMQVAYCMTPPGVLLEFCSAVTTVQPRKQSDGLE